MATLCGSPVFLAAMTLGQPSDTMYARHRHMGCTTMDRVWSMGLLRGCPGRCCKWTLVVQSQSVVHIQQLVCILYALSSVPNHPPSEQTVP